MKKLFKRFSALVLVVMLIFPNAVYAGYKDPVEAGEFITELLQLISDRYIGSEVDIGTLSDAAIRGIMNLLDPYSEYMSAEELADLLDYLAGSYAGIGVTLIRGTDNNIYIDDVQNGSSAQKAGVMPGDMVYKIDGKFVTGWDFESLQNIMDTFGDKSFKLTVIRDFKAIDFTVKREDTVYKTIFCDTLDKVHAASGKDVKNIGYIYISAIGYATGHEFDSAVKRLVDKGVKTVVIDMRNNPGGYVDTALNICGQIVPSGPIIYTQEKGMQKEVHNSTLEKSPFTKVYVVVNGYTASAAEIIASALQDSGAVVVGENSYGKGVIQTLYALSNGGCIKLTTGEYFRRSGEKLNKIGIAPDIAVTDEATGGVDQCIRAVINDIYK